jgi:hypothetical protein
MATIGKSVGFGGINDPVDVCTVQYLLNCVPASNGGPTEELPVDGARSGPSFTRTLEAIRRFQSRIFQGWSDGLVEPHGQTLMHLNRWNPADPSYQGCVKQPSPSASHYTKGVKGEDQSFKFIKGESTAYKERSAASDAALKAVQSAVKYQGFKGAQGLKKWSGASGEAVGVKFANFKGGQGSAMDFEGVKGFQGSAQQKGIKGGHDAQGLKQNPGIKGGYDTKGIKQSPGIKGGAIMPGGQEAIKGNPAAGQHIKGGFTDPFNMKGGGSAAPAGGHVKGGMVNLN